MNLSPTEIRLVRSSWQTLAAKSHEMAIEFYNGLFDEYPQLIPMFSTEVNKQAEKLMFTLGFLVTNLDQLDKIKKSIEELGRVHAKAYKVKPEYYPIVKNGLLKNIKKYMGGEFTDAHHDAWYKTISTVERLMIAAGEKKSGIFSWSFWRRN